MPEKAKLYSNNNKNVENAETMHHQHYVQCRHFFRCKHTLVCFVNSVHLTQRFVGRLKTCKTCVNGRFYQIQRFFLSVWCFSVNNENHLCKWMYVTFVWGYDVQCLYCRFNRWMNNMQCGQLCLKKRNSKLIWFCLEIWNWFHFA